MGRQRERKKKVFCCSGAGAGSESRRQEWKVREQRKVIIGHRHLSQAPRLEIYTDNCYWEHTLCHTDTHTTTHEMRHKHREDRDTAGWMNNVSSVGIILILSINKIFNTVHTHTYFLSEVVLYSGAAAEPSVTSNVHMLAHKWVQIWVSV